MVFLNIKLGGLKMYTCAMCSKNYCKEGQLDKLPLNCQCREEEKQRKIMQLYEEDENYKLAYNSALVEAEGYCKKTRLEEIIDFAKKCNYKRLGLAFCVGLNKEAKIVSSILKNNGFEVNSVVCKNGSIPKEFLKIKDTEKTVPGSYEPMCNPIGQAKLLNKSETELNIILGLCVGHDTLFIKYSDAPVTVFAVKDRVLAHNPLGAVYMAESYYKNKFYK